MQLTLIEEGRPYVSCMIMCTHESLCRITVRRGIDNQAIQHIFSFIYVQYTHHCDARCLRTKPEVQDQS